ncbi:hypothetical protein LCGC14_2611530 [marine sediment metagenome]|uniref:Uncharacterized protein n=1 Tax=marine sediment metagenome TaxID=412755 RepID=A0A0F9CGT2_9ZZZZ
MFGHKKFRAAGLASTVALVGQFGAGLAETGDWGGALIFVDWNLVVGPWLIAIGAQGVADLGKEKAKVEAENK